MLSLDQFHTSLTPCSWLSNGHFYCKRYSQLVTRSWHKHFDSPILGAFSVQARGALSLSTETFGEIISRQWNPFHCGKIFRELFRTQMHIKVNILTRLSRVNNDPGWQNFWVVTNPGVQRDMSFHSHNFVVQDTRWASSVGSLSREHTVRVVLAHSVNC